MGKRQVYKRHYLGFTTETIERLRKPVISTNKRQIQINSTAINVTTVSSLLVKPNPNRKYLIIHNTSSVTDIIINFGSTASVTPQKGILIPTLGNYSAESEAVPDDAIYAVSNGGTVTVVVLEG